MELKEVKHLLDRIKCNYPFFTNDDLTKREWFKELKDYNCDEVTEKLEEHFRSEVFGNTIPKVYFLTKYLIKKNQKNQIEEIKLICPYCKDGISYSEYQKHFDRCSSIDYINRISITYFKKEIDINKYKIMSEEEFNIKYEKAKDLIGEKSLNDLKFKKMNEV